MALDKKNRGIYTDYLRMYNNLDFQIDGVTIHSAGDYGNQVLNSIPESAIDHIEFLRGPAAAMYGQQASIGVIDTFIRRPFEDFSGEVTAGYGSWDQKHAGMGISGAKNGISCLLAVDYSEGDTYIDYQGFQNRSVLLAPTAQLGPAMPGSMGLRTVCRHWCRLKDLSTGCRNGRVRCPWRNSRSKRCPTRRYTRRWIAACERKVTCSRNDPSLWSKISD